MDCITDSHSGISTVGRIFDSLAIRTVSAPMKPIASPTVRGSPYPGRFATVPDGTWAPASQYAPSYHTPQHRLSAPPDACRPFDAAAMASKFLQRPSGAAAAIFGRHSTPDHPLDRKDFPGHPRAHPPPTIQPAAPPDADHPIPGMSPIQILSSPAPAAPGAASSAAQPRSRGIAGGALGGEFWSQGRVQEASDPLIASIESSPGETSAAFALVSPRRRASWRWVTAPAWIVGHDRARFSGLVDRPRDGTTYVPVSPAYGGTCVTLWL